MFNRIFRGAFLAMALAWAPACRAQAEPTIHVNDFVLEGNRLMEAQELEPVLAPYRGKDLNYFELKALAEQLTQLHIRRGYKLVHTYLPEQDLKGGVVRLLFFEGKIGELKVTGADYRDPEMLRSYFEPTLASRDYREDEIMRSLLLVNELPDVSAKLRLEPGQEKGTTDLVLDVDDREPVGVWVNFSNFGARATGRYRFGSTAALTDLSGVGDRLSVSQVLGLPSSNNLNLSASYTRPLNTDGLALHASYANSAYGLGQQFEVLDVRGRADIFHLGLDQALHRSLTHRSDVSLDFSSNSISDSLLGVPFSYDQYWKVGLTYRNLWLDVEGQTFFSLGVEQGFGTSPQALASRVGAGGNFTHFDLEALRVHNLTSQFRWAGRVSAQFALQPLVSAEQFSLGGPYSVRGFSQGEHLADSGYVFSSEFRYSPLADEPRTLELVAFIDHGRASLHRPQDVEVAARSLTGGGFGVRWNFATESHARIDVGFPLSPSVNALGQSPVIYAGLQSRLW
ncbi:ShlB/FhaC/HecB family hemolysin secretion/activation protein [bacterium]|nr:ShlB/FhaC/HecB family hemolysin secretion/activation protein [bacterium]